MHLIQCYTSNSQTFEEIFIKTQPSIIQTRICSPFTLLFAAFIKTHSHGHSGEKLLLKHLTNFITFLTFLHGSQFSFMIVLNVKQVNLFLLNPKLFLLLHHFMKMLLILSTEFQLILKAPFLRLLIITHIVLLSLMP